MSTHALTWAGKQAGLKPISKLVLFQLAWHANQHTGACFPSVSTLAEETGHKRQTVINALRDLTDAGLITPAKQPGRVTYYKLNTEQTTSAANGTTEQTTSAPNGTGTSAPNGTTPVPQTALEDWKEDWNVTSPPTPRTGGGWKKRITTFGANPNTRHRTLAEDLTDTSWAT